MVSHLEYDWLLSNGVRSNKQAGWYNRAPMGMILTGIEQGNNGALSVKSQRRLAERPMGAFSGVRLAAPR